MLRLNTKTFIEKAKEVHRDKYDYSSVIYTGCKNKIKISCLKHGMFEQTPNNHLTGYGCAPCGKELNSLKRKYTLEQFIEKAKKVHGDKYDYSKFIYIDIKSRSIIICLKHGEFQQTPSDHINCKSGCPKCANFLKNKDTRWTTEIFIEKAKEVHGDKYDYSLVDYKTAIINIIIICKIHGPFDQTPYTHLNSGGCSKCSFIKMGINTRKTVNEFIEKAKEVHGDIYDYSKVICEGMASKVIIICKIHGEFKQNAMSHLQGCACPSCRSRSYSKIQIKWLKFMSIANPSLQYIGNGGEHRIKGTLYHADGFIPETNHVLEFHGCFFHGCIECYPERDKLNPLNKKSYKELYDITIQRKNKILELGYKYTEIWECKFKKLIHSS
jgi:G:T-mismatch repair DNA endonuclease (very short patch repair protein)